MVALVLFSHHKENRPAANQRIGNERFTPKRFELRLIPTPFDFTQLRQILIAVWIFVAEAPRQIFNRRGQSSGFFCLDFSFAGSRLAQQESR